MDIETDRAANGSDQSDRGIIPWTIKGIPPEIRQAAITHAKLAKQSQGEWLSRAIRTLIQHDRQQTRMPALVDPPVRPSDEGSDLAELAGLVQLAMEVSGDKQTKVLAAARRAVMRRLEVVVG